MVPHYYMNPKKTIPECEISMAEIVENNNDNDLYNLTTLSPSIVQSITYIQSSSTASGTSTITVLPNTPGRLDFYIKYSTYSTGTDGFPTNTLYVDSAIVVCGTESFVTKSLDITYYITIYPDPTNSTDHNIDIDDFFTIDYSTSDL